MKLFLIGLLCFFVAVQSKAVDDEEIYIESSGEDPSEGKRPVKIKSMISDDEDLDTETEGSGSVLATTTDSNGMEFEAETTEMTVTTEFKVVDKYPGKKIVKIEDNGDESESDQKEPTLDEPKEKTDSDEETDDEVDVKPHAATGASVEFLAAVIVGGCIGLLFAICVIMLLVYRMRKKDEGSYELGYGLDKKPQGNYEYTKGVDSKEYFA